MVDEKTLLGLCRHTVSAGERMGADAVEALARSGSVTESNIELGQVSGVSRRLAEEIAVRVYSGGRMGSAFTNIPTREAVEEAVSLALKAARASTEDRDWVSLPRPAEYPSIEGLWSDEVEGCDPARVVEIAGELMGRVKEAEPDAVPAFGGSGAVVQRTAYANSGGVTHSERGTASYAYIAAIAKTESGVTPAISSFEASRGMGLDLGRAAEDLSSMIRVCKRTAGGRTGRHPVIMHPDAYGQLLRFTLMEAVRGDNVARGKSKIADRMGEVVASESLTILDDGTEPRGINTSLADDEGVPRRRTPIIERGVLRSFLWDTYWANKTGAESTGNASRDMRRGLVEIRASNVVVEPGGREVGEIVSEVGHGYLIRDVQGAHSSNPESGDFSVVGNPAVLIEGGEMVGAVHGLMVAGNVFELLGDVVEVARTPIRLQGLIGPEIVFGGVRVIAKG